jgi:hypothetical protein
MIAGAILFLWLVYEIVMYCFCTKKKSKGLSKEQKEMIAKIRQERLKREANSNSAKMNHFKKNK